MCYCCVACKVLIINTIVTQIPSDFESIGEVISLIINHICATAGIAKTVAGGV